MKIGRNEKCSYGSGKKYKKCCLRTDDHIPPEVLERFTEYYRKQEYLKKIGLHIGFVKPVEFQGQNIRALANVIYKRPLKETFHDFIIRFLINKLGKAWMDQQETADKKHFLYKCYQELLNRRENLFKKSPTSLEQISGTPNGYVQYFLQLAFDVVSLIQTSNLPNSKLLKRIKDYNQFQGARYEMAIAAIFARLGYKIHFHDEVTDKKKCEFIATNNESNISVEAKSRHRKGSLNNEGELVVPIKIAEDVVRMVGEALTQNPNNGPFIIFIDLNLPTFPTEEWNKQLKEMVGTFVKQQYEDQLSKISGLIITNFEHHYAGQDFVDSSNALMIIPQTPLFPLELMFFIQLKSLLDNYGEIPNLDMI